MWTEDQGRYVSRAIGEARDRLVLKQDMVIGQDIVFETIIFAAETSRRQFVSGLSPQKLKAMFMAYEKEDWEIEGDIAQRWIDVAAGDPIDLVFGYRTLPSPQEVSTMEAVNAVFKSLIKGDKPDRDWKMLNLLTVPNASLRRIAKMFHITHTRVAAIKVVQAQAIWNGIKHLLPGRQQESTGTLWVTPPEEEAA
jgi:hypothetical protein